MIKRALFGFGIMLLSTSLLGAQCNCGSPSCNAMPIGTDYTDAAYGDRVTPQDSCGCDGRSCDFDCYAPCDRDCSALRKCRYIAGFGGWNGNEDFQVANDVPDGGDVNSGSLDDGELFGFAIGSRLHPYVRFELEGSYRENDVESWTVQQFNGGQLSSQVIEAATGDVEAYAGMVNFIFDFVPRKPGCWQPYGGVGFGGASFDGAFVTNTNTYIVDDSSFAWQAIGGLSFAIGKKADAYLEYRYFEAPFVGVFDTANGVPLGDFEMVNNGLVGGLRITF